MTAFGLYRQPRLRAVPELLRLLAAVVPVSKMVKLTLHRRRKRLLSHLRAQSLPLWAHQIPEWQLLPLRRAAYPPLGPAMLEIRIPSHRVEAEM